MLLAGSVPPANPAKLLERKSPDRPISGCTIGSTSSQKALSSSSRQSSSDLQQQQQHKRATPQTSMRGALLLLHPVPHIPSFRALFCPFSTLHTYHYLVLYCRQSVTDLGNDLSLFIDLTVDREAQFGSLAIHSIDQLLFSCVSSHQLLAF